MAAAQIQNSDSRADGDAALFDPSDRIHRLHPVKLRVIAMVDEAPQ
jgi:hypothetical protein